MHPLLHFYILTPSTCRNACVLRHVHRFLPWSWISRIFCPRTKAKKQYLPQCLLMGTGWAPKLQPNRALQFFTLREELQHKTRVPNF